MAKVRSFELTARRENLREEKPVTPPVHFSLQEIRDHFRDSLKEITAQTRVAAALKSRNNPEGAKFIYRAQIVLAEGLLDFYLHEISKYCLFKMFTGQWDKSPKYASLKIPMERVEKGLNARESSEWFFEHLNERFSRDVFISKDSMREQLNLIGINFEEVMSKAFAKLNNASKEGGQIVAKLFERRNVIAHQNDRNHANAEQNDIDRASVAEYIQHVVNIVNAIHELAKAKG